MIELKNVNFKYLNSDAGALTDVSLQIPTGQCVLLCGESGCGKTTVTRLINGLIPHYYDGELTGSVSVNGLDTAKAELYETALKVGSVFQNPRSQFFCVDTSSEIAFGCENAGMPPKEVLRRVDEAAEQLHIKNLLGRNIFGLSGGEKQKVACACVSAVHPEVFVLDEPTSNLDIESIESLKSTLAMWKSQGKTVVIAEHRLYWLSEVCDRVIYMKGGKIAFDVPMSEFRLYPAEKISALGLRAMSFGDISPMQKPFVGDKSAFTLNNFTYNYGKKQALSIDNLSLPIGAVIAVIGHNGAGKSTFSRCLCGLEKHFKGKSVFDGIRYDRRKMLKKSYMVMQDVNHQLFCETVDDEVRLGMNDENSDDVSAVLEKLNLSDFSLRHPMSLSGGQKQRVAVACAILADKEILIFDEPTSGLDFRSMQQTADLIYSLRGKKTVFIVTHDAELIVRCCTHILHLESGKVCDFYPLCSDTENKFKTFFTGGNNGADVRTEPNRAVSEQTTAPCAI